MEIVHDGWLLKSPPPKRLWRAKWRNRWFVLKSGDLPGQYFLEYYTDSTCRKLKGKIDLEECEQVDAGITFAQRKFEYKHMFDIKTPKRVYYLCAESDEAMNKWVESVCQVCGLRVMNQEDLYAPTATPLLFDQARPIEYPSVDSPPPSASSTISGPYIPISECITGRKAHSNSTRFPFTNEAQLSLSSDNQRSSIPNEMAPPAPVISDIGTRLTGTKPREHYDGNRSLRPSIAMSEDTLSIQSPIGTDGQYVVFSDDEKSAHSRKEDNNNKQLTKDVREDNVNNEGDNPQNVAAPPRPPKPPHLAEVCQQNYMNLDTIIRVTNIRRNSSSDKSKCGSIRSTAHLALPESSISSSDAEPSPASVSSSVPPNTPRDTGDEDIKIYNNDSSVINVERTRRTGLNSCVGQSRVFSYDNQTQIVDRVTEMDPRISPLSSYLNIPQQNKSSYVPPAVDRGLKPKKTSESTSLSPFELSPPTSGGAVSELGISLVAIGGIPAPPSSAPPIVDRNLKPHKKTSDPSLGPTPQFVLDPAPRSRLRNPDHRKPRAAPSPTPPSMRNGRSNDSDTDPDSISSPGSRRDSTNEEQIFFSLNAVNRRSSHEIQYLDLDLEAQAIPSSPKSSKGGNGAKVVPMEPSVIYKKVDFVKTEAFNNMRKNIEEGYRKNQ